MVRFLMGLGGVECAELTQWSVVVVSVKAFLN